MAFSPFEGGYPPVSKGESASSAFAMGLRNATHNLGTVGERGKKNYMQGGLQPKRDFFVSKDRPDYLVRI